jgi:hypothetical protein
MNIEKLESELENALVCASQHPYEQFPIIISALKMTIMEEIAEYSVEKYSEGFDTGYRIGYTSRVQDENLGRA